MKLGTVLPSFYPPALLETSIDDAHAAGLDSLWVSDHMLGLFHPDLFPEVGFAELVSDPDALFDPFCVCAWAARHTDLPLGLAVTDGIRRAAPDVARAALTLHHLCAGGFNLGIGCGEAENLVPFGYPFERPVARTQEFLGVLRHLLDVGNMPNGVGRLGLPLRSDVGQPSIWVAAHRPRMLRLTGRYADGWLPAEARSPEQYRTMKSTVAEHARSVGRAEPESGLLAFVLLGESRERVQKMFDSRPITKSFVFWAAPAEAWARYGLPAPSGSGSRGYIDVIPHELDPVALRGLAPRIPFAMVEEFIFIGNAAEVAERLQGYVDAGLEHLVMLNLTGLVGGMEEVVARGSDLRELCGLLKGTAGA
jgi:phthiodiolone/phenolphthiodiolone dimycocerosates ketoreductase